MGFFCEFLRHVLIFLFRLQGFGSNYSAIHANDGSAEHKGICHIEAGIADIGERYFV